MDDYFLFQYVTFPTRNREGQSPSTLDLIITSEDNVIENLIASDPLGKSDHIVMEYEYIYSIRIPESKNSKYLYEKGDYQSFNEELMCTDWDQLFTNMSIEEMWASFHARYLSLLNKYIPTQRTSIRLNSAPLWMNKSVLSTIKVKRKAWFKYKATHCHSDYVTYASCRNRSTEAVRKAKYNFEKTLVDGVASNPKRFWKYVQSKTKIKQSIRSIERTDGTITSDDSEIAEILNNFLVVFSQMRIYQTYHHWELSIPGNPCHLCKSLLRVSGGSCVDLIHLNLLVPITVILEFFGKSRGVCCGLYSCCSKGH